MSGLVNSAGMPIGRVGESMAPNRETKGIDPELIARCIQVFIQQEKSKEGEKAIEQKVQINRRKVDTAVAFWKPIYLHASVEGRHLNGIEAYELGDPVKNPDISCDKGPYIAMCNLMALEAIKMMGDNMPTSTEAVLLAYATEREKEIAQFWKTTFAPTEFQVEWAWKGALAVMAGDPGATKELLEDYKQQLP